MAIYSRGEGNEYEYSFQDEQGNYYDKDGRILVFDDGGNRGEWVDSGRKPMRTDDQAKALNAAGFKEMNFAPELNWGGAMPFQTANPFSNLFYNPQTGQVVSTETDPREAKRFEAIAGGAGPAGSVMLNGGIGGVQKQAEQYRDSIYTGPKNFIGDMLAQYGLPAMMAGVGGLALSGAGTFGAEAAGGLAGEAAGTLGTSPFTTGGMSTLQQAFNPVTGLMETVGGPISTSGGFLSGAGAAGGAAGALNTAGVIGTNALGQAVDIAGNVIGPMNNPSMIEQFMNTNTPPTPPSNGTQAPAPVQNGPTTPGSGPGGSIPGVNNPLGNAQIGTAGSAISRILNGSATAEDWLSVGGNLGTGLLSAYASNSQTNALQGLADQNRAERAPFLQKATGYLNDPASYAAGPGQAALKGTLAGLSVQGNPFGSGTALQFATDTGNKNWLNAVNTLGSLGLGGQGIQANLDSQAVGSNSNMWNALGATANNIFNPAPSQSQTLASLAQLLKQGA